MKVLICDDSLLIRTRLKEDLEQFFRCACLLAEDGERAVALYKENAPDLVLMDVVMPALDGIEALREIIKFNNHARVIMISSAGTRTNLKQAIEAGALDFIQKPWEKKRLVSVVSMVMKGEFDV